MGNDIILKEVNGEVLASSREVAERFEKRHSDVLEKISKLEDEIQPTENSARYFMVSEYIDTKGENRKEYSLSRDGFSLIVMGFTGSKALEWKLKYIDAFNKMEARLKEQNVRALPTTYKEALIQLIHQLDENEKLLEEIDVYERFLCTKTGSLSKTGLATKLDAKPQTVAALFKKLGVYTSTSQVSADFLRKYQEIKLIKETSDTYIDKKTGENKEKVGWEWTYDGAKTVVDYLVKLGKVVLTENHGFKLKKA